MEDTYGYTLERVPLGGDRVRVLQLVPPSGPSHAPLRQFGKKASNRAAAGKLFDTLEQVSKVELLTSYKVSGTVKTLDAPIVEVRVPRLTVRAISYNRNGEDVLVIIDVIEGQKGTGKIPPEAMKNFKGKIDIIEKLLENVNTQPSL